MLSCARKIHNVLSLIRHRTALPSKIPVVRRWVTTTSSTPSGAPRRSVIPRRSWNAFKDTLPPKPPPAAKYKADDKPWPRSVQITGYVVGSILVPYIGLWWITSNPTLRLWFGPYLPMDKLRSHFGHLEWNVQSYVDEQQIDEQQKSGEQSIESNNLNKPILDVQYYQFPQEPPLRERQQQEIVDSLDETSVVVKIYVLDDNGMPSQEAVQTVPASTRATAENLWRVLQNTMDASSKTTIPTLSAGSMPDVAVDFEDNDTEIIVPMSSIVDDDSSSFDNTPSLASSLLRETQTISTWFYVPEQQKQQQDSSTWSSETEMKISRLEHAVSELQKSLKNPTSTRDMDEMAAELKQAKRELSSLRWKRRLGRS